MEGESEDGDDMLFSMCPNSLVCGVVFLAREACLQVLGLEAKP